MLVFRILGTIFVGISCLTAFIKNVNVFVGHESDDALIIGTTIYGLLWRAFVIVALWII